jgi:very-short-patch-repair endonuclease
MTTHASLAPKGGEGRVRGALCDGLRPYGSASLAPRGGEGRVRGAVCEDLKPYARKLRQAQTNAERRMWMLLRDRRLSGCKFRRQHPLGPYIADFCCPEVRLIIELDGGHHASNQNADATRSLVLETQGYRVLRFWNNEVLGNTAGVLQRIVEALKTPHPALSPEGRGIDEGG